MKMRLRLLHHLFVGALALAAVNFSFGQLVNIDARVSGSQPGPGQAYWLNPFSAVSLSLSAGTYSFTLVDPAIDPAAKFTAWTYNAPWITTYAVFDSTNLTHELFLGAHSTVSSLNAAAAFNTTVAAGLNVTTYTFSAPITLLFAIPDNILGDNAGGVSIEVAPSIVDPPPPAPGAVPEPSTYGFFGAIVLAGLAVVRKKTARSLQLIERG